MALPVTSLYPPNAVVEIQPGMTVQALCLINAPAGAGLVTGQGHSSNVTVAVQPGMNVRAACQISTSGQLITS